MKCMKKLFIFTLGFEEKFAMRMITAHGLDQGDKLLFITGPMVEKTKRTIDFIKGFIEKYFLGQVQMEIMEIKSLESFIGIVSKIYSKITNEEKNYDRIIVNLSGGMRILVLATYTAIILATLNRKILEKTKIELETEDLSVKLTIPNILIKVQELIKLSKEKLEILKCLIEREKTVKELAEELHKDETTIRRHLIDLVEIGVVKKIEERPTKYKLHKDLKFLLTVLF